jgi:hypothetical protein
MAKLTLEERISALEKQVAELREAMAQKADIKDWRRTIGMFTGDEIMRQVFEEALKFREKDRERARRMYAKRDRRTKS